LNPLRAFTDDQLLTELMRRRNTKAVEAPEHWCHDCARFVTWDQAPRKGQMPDNFNPCTRKHEMQFNAPAEIDDEYGFYRTICVDRKARP